jgi:hypothetical protein
MPSAALSLKLPVKTFLAFTALGVLELVLIGLPGPCGMPGVLDSAFDSHREVEFWLASAMMLTAVVGALLSIVWWISATVVRRIPK